MEQANQATSQASQPSVPTGSSTISPVHQSMEADVLLNKIAELSQRLEEANPDITNYVRDIHRNLLQYPELVHILKPEEVVTIVKAIEINNGEKILDETKKTKKATGTKKESLADLLSGI